MCTARNKDDDLHAEKKEKYGAKKSDLTLPPGSAYMEGVSQNYFPFFH